MRWNFAMSLTELYSNDDECWPVEVISKTYFCSVAQNRQCTSLCQDGERRYLRFMSDAYLNFFFIQLADTAFGPEHDKKFDASFLRRYENQACALAINPSPEKTDNGCTCILVWNLDINAKGEAWHHSIVWFVFHPSAGPSLHIYRLLVAP